MPTYSEDMIKRIDADPKLTPEQKRELKVRWGWQDTKGSISAAPKTSWLDPAKKIAELIEKTTNTTGPVTEAIRALGGPGDFDKGAGKATSILGGFAKEPIRQAAKRFEALVPESVKRIGTERTKNRMARMFSEHANDLPLQDRVRAIDVAGSDPIANLMIQDGIEMVDNVIMSPRGKYDSIFGAYGMTSDADAIAQMEMFAQAARSGSTKRAADLMRQLARDARQQVYGTPQAISINKRAMLGGRDLANTMAHEGTHASQDRMGILSDPRLRPSHYATQPIEWEANFAGNFQQDPASLDIPGMLQRGQRSMFSRGHEPDQDVMRRVLGALNRGLIDTGKTGKLLDIEQDALGPLVKASRPGEFLDQDLSALVRGLLGI